MNAVLSRLRATGSHLEAFAATLVAGEHADAAAAGHGSCAHHFLIASAASLIVAAPLLSFALPVPFAIAAGMALAAAPLAGLCLLIATGRETRARTSYHAGTLAVLAALAAATGGLASPFLAWLALVPLEAALTARSRLVALTVLGLAALLTALAAVAGTQAMVALKAPAEAATATGAMLYGAALVARALRLHRRPLEHDRPPADTAGLEPFFPGLVVRCDASARPVSVGGSHAHRFFGEETDGAPALMSLVRVSDRVTLLHALGEVRAGSAGQTVTIRLASRTLENGERLFVPIRFEISGRYENGRLAEIVAFGRDVSHEAALEAAAEASEKRALQAEAAKAHFLAGVSHELRTPLSAILGFSDVLGQEFFGVLANERQREYVTLIRQSGEHLLSVVNTMLDMSRIEADRFELRQEPFAPAEAMDACLAMLGEQARAKGLVLTGRVEKACPDLTADRRAVQQILVNLVSNAIKFTDAGGVVTVDIGADEEQTRITVRDTGIGIPGAMLSRIGEPFFQVQSDYARQFEGTGLGLSLVKGLVSLHEGSFAVSSREGEGTTVTVTLPTAGVARRARENNAAVCRLGRAAPAETGRGVNASAENDDERYLRSA